MKTLVSTMALVVAALAAPAAIAAPAAPATPATATPADVDAWLAQADKAYAEQTVTSGRAEWVYETYITDDTAQITADAGATMSKLQVAQAKQAAEFAKVPGLSPEDQVGKPKRPNDPVIPDDPLQRLAYYQAQASTQTYTGTGNFGSPDTALRLAGPDSSLFEVTLTMDANLQAPDVATTLKSGGGAAATGGSFPGGPPTGAFPGGPPGVPGRPAMHRCSAGRDAEDRDPAARSRRCCPRPIPPFRPPFSKS